jgi:hypothetical protein
MVQCFRVHVLRITNQSSQKTPSAYLLLCSAQAKPFTQKEAGTRYISPCPTIDVITKKKLAFAMDFPENDEKKH